MRCGAVNKIAPPKSVHLSLDLLYLAYGFPPLYPLLVSVSLDVFYPFPSPYKSRVCTVTTTSIAVVAVVVVLLPAYHVVS